ncbi:TetR/AcrR family transcriptional regulator [Pseudenhygromyxa sp. WMMC2535]|uniref:TetR/AcrR family transcriptional regulator n=1 Tax=Pseudenhygromyxa sp. WMMC2535 TaxID=2712867 RepID=UPI0015578E67|nr:TetR/AcrR family transcriptional regulator [Pseudenhygromyxa sp. WMMC2535]NVB40528.1 TetR/AcrR family transcriptional regulator [Pseudenhygromyxa sp. WMMC2535]
MPKPTFLNLPDEKRLRITELAIDEFSTYPYRQASLSRIVSRAGIAKGSMYQYFDNKLDLYHWLLVDELPRRREAWQAGREGQVGRGGLFETVEQRALAAVGFLLAHPRLARLATTAMEPTTDAELRPLHEELRREELSGLTQAIRDAQGRGEVREELDADALAHMIEALVLRGIPEAVLAHTRLDVHELIAEPTRGQQVDEESWRSLVRQSLDLIRSGITAASVGDDEAGAPLGWSSPAKTPAPAPAPAPEVSPVPEAAPR